MVELFWNSIAFTLPAASSDRISVMRGTLRRSLQRSKINFFFKFLERRGARDTLAIIFLRELVNAGVMLSGTAQKLEQRGIIEAETTSSMALFRVTDDETQNRQVWRELNNNY